MKKIFFIIILPFLVISSLSGQNGKKINSNKAAIIKIIESLQDELIMISDSIWSYAETGLIEYKSSGLLPILQKKTDLRLNEVSLACRQLLLLHMVMVNR